MDWTTFLGPEGLFSPDRLMAVVRAGGTLVVGLLLARLLARGAAKLIGTRTGPQQTMLAKRLVFYTVATLVVLSALSQLGINLGFLLGAAGVLTVALGFASQTSASNLISGLFLMAERPFGVGDYLRVGEVVGEVLSIDLLSVKLRTFDNSLVRIPNENIIKDQLTNLTFFPIRRIDVVLGVAYKEDIERVRHVLFAVADANPECLDEPRPQFYFEGFGDSALMMRFGVWTRKQAFYQLKNVIHMQIKQELDREGIEIPFPHRTLYTGSVTEPFPVTVVDGPILPPSVVESEGGLT